MAFRSCVCHARSFIVLHIATAVDRSNSTGTLSLTNGGPAGAIWVFLAVICGMFTVVLSMAEMAAL